MADAPSTIPEVPLSSIIVYKQEHDPIRADLVVLDGDPGGDTIQGALQKLSGHKIIAAPVRTPLGGYMMVDLAAIALALTTNVESGDDSITSVCNLAEKRETLDIKNNMRTAISLLSQRDVHRLLITKEGIPYNIISQMDIVQYLIAHPHLMTGKSYDLPVQNIMSSPPVVVKSTDLATDALRKIVVDAYSGAAVVDEDGRICANFSLSDMRAVHRGNIYHLFSLSVERFLKETDQFWHIPVTLTPQDSLSRVMRHMNQYHIHRVHVVDSDSKPIGVVSCTDVIKAIDVILD